MGSDASSLPFELVAAGGTAVHSSKTFPISFFGVLGRPRISLSEVDAVGTAAGEGRSKEGGFGAAAGCLRSFFFCLALFFGMAVGREDWSGL